MISPRTMHAPIGTIRINFSQAFPEKIRAVQIKIITGGR